MSARVRQTVPLPGKVCRHVCGGFHTVGLVASSSAKQVVGKGSGNLLCLAQLSALNHRPLVISVKCGHGLSPGLSWLVRQSYDRMFPMKAFHSSPLVRTSLLMSLRMLIEGTEVLFRHDTSHQEYYDGTFTVSPLMTSPPFMSTTNPPNEVIAALFPCLFLPFQCH